VLGLAGGATAETARVNYMLQCMGCHLADGTGRAGVVPSFRDRVGRFATVRGGREYLVRVPGSAQSPLSDAELAEVLNWIIRRFGPREIADALEPFDAREVARVRSAPLTDVEPVRRELLRQIEEAGEDLLDRE
jgi:hypothetical protein